MSHPETTCSSSHLRACSSVGKCWLVVFRKPSWPYSCGGHPGTAPSILPNAAPALEAASGFRGARCLWVWTHLGDGASGEDLSSLQCPRGQSPNLSVHNGFWKMPEITWPVGGSPRIQTRPPDSPVSFLPHSPSPRPATPHNGWAWPGRRRGDQHTRQQATWEPREGSTCPPYRSRRQC